MKFLLLAIAVVLVGCGEENGYSSKEAHDYEKALGIINFSKQFPDDPEERAKVREGLLLMHKSAEQGWPYAQSFLAGYYQNHGPSGRIGGNEKHWRDFPDNYVKAAMWYTICNANDGGYESNFKGMTNVWPHRFDARTIEEKLVTARGRAKEKIRKNPKLLKYKGVQF